MTRRIVIVLLAALCATAPAQTIRTLGYNTTNGQIVAATNVVWTNAFNFSSNTVAAAVRTNLGLEAAWLTNNDSLALRDVLFPSYDPFGGGNQVSVTTDTVSAPVLQASNTAGFGAPKSAGRVVLFSPGTNDTDLYTATLMFSDGVVGGYGQFTAPTNNISTTNYLPPASGQLAVLGHGYLGTNATTTRTNLGFVLPALTNTSNVTMMRALAGSTNTNEPYSGSISVTGTNNTNTLVFSNGILQSVQ